MAALAILGLVIAGYLTLIKLAGGIPVCGPVSGCADVAQSEYSAILGIPTAAFGALFSAALVILGLAWARTGDRRALVAAYGLGLFGVIVVGYLTYLELFVIHAVCTWCVVYGLSVVAGWLVAALSLRRFARPA
ncbi:MAG: vitamin K epoxide reductase family protein [Chloroflexota bacterium]|nr:vitamin K epoxide reductase family protein [Chloroflexota bacterium]